MSQVFIKQETMLDHVLRKQKSAEALARNHRLRTACKSKPAFSFWPRTGQRIHLENVPFPMEKPCHQTKGQEGRGITISNFANLLIILVR